MVVAKLLRLPYSRSGLIEGLFVEVTGCDVAVQGVTASEGTDREVSVCDILYVKRLLIKRFFTFKTMEESN